MCLYSYLLKLTLQSQQPPSPKRVRSKGQGGIAPPAHKRSRIRGSTRGKNKVTGGPERGPQRAPNGPPTGPPTTRHDTDLTLTAAVVSPPGARGPGLVGRSLGLA